MSKSWCPDLQALSSFSLNKSPTEVGTLNTDQSRSTLLTASYPGSISGCG